MTDKEVAERTEALLHQMTLEEKVAQMVQIPYSHIGREESLKWAARGAGSFLHVLGDEAREIQQTALNSRLGIPVIFGIDAIHGHCLNDHATIFPSQLAQACSWNPELSRKVGRVTAREVATDGLHWTFSPVLCLGRDTRWGRIDETFGEDPYLSAIMGEGIIKGYQGDDLSDNESILACAKHYIAYGESTGGRDAYDSEITWRKLREVFLAPFKKAIEAGCATFMTAYGSIDGTPLTASSKALKEILRDECGFDGFVVTDWDNCNSLLINQHLASNMEDAAVITANAGNDMIMSTLTFYEAALNGVKNGRIDIKVIDDAVRHILIVKFRLGLFEHPEKKGIPGCIGCEEHLTAAKEVANASVTLLKNNGILPLKGGKIAVIGANADDIRAQYGDWTYFTHPRNNPNHIAVRPYVTIREGLEAIGSTYGSQITYCRGCGPIADPSDDIQAAANIAAVNDVAIVVVGDVISQHGEKKDRANLSLSGRQSELLRAIKATGTPMVCVLVSSKPLCLDEADAMSDALVVAFNGGMFGGESVAKVLFGAINPEGRLPISFPRHSGQLPVYYNHYSGWHSSGKYCDLQSGPLYAFGEGLSYTSFAYSNLTWNADSMTATVTVTNKGTQAGTETVQVYYHDLIASILTPVKNLCAFKKVYLENGESKQISFSFKKEDFSIVLPNEERVTESGEFVLMVGHSSRDQDLLSISFTL